MNQLYKNRKINKIVDFVSLRRLHTLQRDGLPHPVGTPLDKDAMPLAHVLVPVLERDPRLAAAALLPLRAARRLVLGHVARRVLGAAVLADQRQLRAQRAL